MAYDRSNVFARILRGEIPAHTVLEDEHTLAFMDVMPQADGHALVIPKAEAETIFDLAARVAGRDHPRHAARRARGEEGLRRTGRDDRPAQRSRRGPERIPRPLSRAAASRGARTALPRARHGRPGRARGARGARPGRARLSGGASRIDGGENRHEQALRSAGRLRGGSAHPPRRLRPHVRGVGARPRGVLVADGAAHRLDPSLHEGEGRQLRRPRLPHPLVPRRPAQRGGELPRSPPRRARRQDRDPVGRRRPDAVAGRHLPRAVPPRLQARQRLEVARRAEGRPRDDLPADDPRGGGRDARLRAHRRDPLGGVRRVLARLARRPHLRLRLDGRDHGRRRHPRRQEGAAQGQRGPGAVEPRHRDRAARAGGEPHRRHGADVPPRPLVPRGGGRPARRVPARDRWTRRTRSSSSTPRARPASPRACCTRAAATSSTRRSPTRRCSTSATTTSSGARPTSAG